MVCTYTCMSELYNMCDLTLVVWPSGHEKNSTSSVALVLLKRLIRTLHVLYTVFWLVILWVQEQSSYSTVI
jgi:hypothetical protein